MKNAKETHDSENSNEQIRFSAIHSDIQNVFPLE